MIKIINLSYCQESIDNLVYEIEKTIFSDTITVLDSPRVDTKPIKVIAFLKDDILLKTIATYSNSTRLRFTYYDKQENTPVYVKDIDSLTKDILLEVYTQENSSEILLNICDQILKSFSADIYIKDRKFVHPKISEINIEEGQDGKTFKGNVFLSAIVENN